MIFLAQITAPPLQQGPVRLPAPNPGTERLGDEQPRRVPLIEGKPPAITPSLPIQRQDQHNKEGFLELGGDYPPIAGHLPYSPEILRLTLRDCLAEKPDQRLNACAAALTAKLKADGYISTRVYVDSETIPGSLEVVEGKIVEIRVNGDSARQRHRVENLLRSLKSKALNIQLIEKDLQRVRELPGIRGVRASLSPLGSDPTIVVLSIQIEKEAIPWIGELSIRNDGSNGSGDARALATFLKRDAISEGDTILIYGELDSDAKPDLGQAIGSLSYTLPVSNSLNLTGAFGYSRRNLTEFQTNGAPMVSTSQYQGTGQLEWVLREDLWRRWSISASLTESRTNLYFDDKVPFPLDYPSSVAAPVTGFAKLAVNGSGGGNQISWGISSYLLQGIPALSPGDQQSQFRDAGIDISSATAFGVYGAVSLMLTPSLNLQLTGAGQLANNPLTPSMRFVLGSDTGLRGLPGQLISGDSGWLGSSELAWTFWKSKTQSLALVPFFGYGSVSTDNRVSDILSYHDNIGSGGLLLRWLYGRKLLFEFGWAEQFATSGNSGPWEDWALGKGFYGKVRYRF